MRSRLLRFTAIYQQVPEGGYVAQVAEIPNAFSQGETLEEAREMLADALRLMWEENRNAALAEAEAEGDDVTEPLELELPV